MEDCILIWLYISAWQQDNTVVIKHPKKSPLFLRMIVLVFAMVCGVYICSICLKQISSVTKIKFERIQIASRPSLDKSMKQVLERPSLEENIEQFHIPRLHYPTPQTFSR